MDYTEDRLRQILKEIKPLDADAIKAAKSRQARLAKPPGSLGRLEELSIQLAGITGTVKNEMKKKRILVFCADNGVVKEGVASAPQSVTAAQTINLTRGMTGAAVLARRFGCELSVCDVGVNADMSDSRFINRKIAYGTANIAQGAAMTREQAVQAILSGYDLAVDAVRGGADVLGVGEMGIGNTTTSSAVLSVITGKPVHDVTGRGGGLTDGMFVHKLSVIEKAIQINRPDPEDTVDVIAKVGGFDIAAMAGAFIGAAVMRVPVVIDGFISAAAALCAYRLCPDTRAYMIPSHASAEVGYRAAMEALGLRPLFDLGMRLGEGSGCPIAMMMLDAACAVMNDMATFEEAGIDDGYLDAIRSIDTC
jgi:nicotinate-nucleotide--dimethylbenzimidazole phosphoribosyltransferase